MDRQDSRARNRISGRHGDAADNAHVLLSRDGTGSEAALASITGGGQVHLILDVNGYYP
jgi:hypothetical protein